MNIVETVLELENVTMQFGGVVAVDSFSMHVDQGETVALIGPNGAGKTTAFNVITGVYAPTNGCVKLRGKIIAQGHPTGKMRKLYAGTHIGEYNRLVSNTPDRITEMGVARTFQNIRLFKNMTVLENVLVASLGRRKMAKARETAEAVIEECGLKDFIAMPAGSLNVLQKKRLEIARALATEPKLLLLDETMAGLSGIERQDATALIRQIHARGVTILMIEHVMEIVMNVSDKVVVLNGGKLLMEGTPKEVASNEEVISAYLGGTTW